jgi:hypothetical protein
LAPDCEFARAEIGGAMKWQLITSYGRGILGDDNRRGISLSEGAKSVRVNSESVSIENGESKKQFKEHQK